MSIGEVSGKMTMRTAGWERGLSSATMSLKTHGRKAKAIYRDTRTAAETYSLSIAEVGAMHKRGMLDANTYGRKIAMINKAFHGPAPDKMLTRMGKAAGVARTKFNQAGRSILMFGKSTIAMLGAGGVVYGLKKTIDSIDKLGHVASKLGMTTEALGKLRYAAKLSGVEANTFDMAIQRMTRRLSEASHGAGEAQGALAELSKFGLPDPSKLAAMSPGKAFAEIADAMSKVQHQSDRVRLSFKLFDSEGVALVNTLKMGRAGLEAAGREAERFGLAIGSIGVKRVQEARQGLDRMGAAASGVFAEMTIAISPYVTAVGEDLVKAYSQAGTAALDASNKMDVSPMQQKVGVIADIWHSVGLGIGFAKAEMTEFFANMVGMAQKTRAFFDKTFHPEEPRGKTGMGEPYRLFQPKYKRPDDEVTGFGQNLFPRGKAPDPNRGFLGTLAQDLWKASDEQHAAFNKMLTAKTPSERAAARGRSGAGLEPTVATDTVAGESVSKATALIDALDARIATFGKTKFEVDLSKLQGDVAREPARVEVPAAGESVARVPEGLKFQVAEAGRRMATLKRLEDKASQADASKAIFESTRTPMERFKADLADAGKLLNVGAITEDTFTRHAEMLRGQAIDRIAPEGRDKASRMEFATADVYGSEAAVSAIARAKAPGMSRAEDKASKERQETNLILREEIAELLERVVREIKKIGPTEMDTPP